MENTTTTTKLQGSSSEEEGQQQPSLKQQPSRNRRDNSNDVLTLKGAAAQQTTHRGNLNYYALCEERFDRWAALDCDDPERKQICKEIVKIVSERGGVFRKASGGAMDIRAAIDKTNARFRQIAKPKLRVHTGMYGENDVVFAKGARNHMYPGNAKWRSLLDGYALSYHRDMDKIEEKRKTTFFTPPRPSYQVDIVEEVISIVEKRGGKFLDEKLKQLGHNVIVEKTHNRFKDMKKEIKSGKLVLTATKKEEPTDDAGEDIQANNKSATSVVIKSRELVTPGFTSVKATVSSKKELQKMIAKSQRKRKKFYGNQYKDAGEVILDDVSIPSVASSDEYETEDDAAADMDERAKEDEVFKNSPRYERRKRRASGEPAPPRPSTQEEQTKKTIKKERKQTKQIKKEKRRRAPSPEPYTLSEYEQMRLVKVQRNHKRLKDLGLG